MRYAFVFVSIVAIWVALIGMVMADILPGVTAHVVALSMTVVLFIIGFRK